MNVADAIKALSAFGPLDRKTAKVMLRMWAGYRTLTPAQVREVLATYR